MFRDSQASARKRSRKLRLETLENRRVLATILWDGGAGTSNWHDADNWVGDVLPGVADDVVIDLPDAGTIQSSSNVTINSLNSETASLKLFGGTFSIRGQSHIAHGLNLRSVLNTQGDLTVGGSVILGHVIPNGTSTQHLFGTISGAGDLIVNGQLDWWIGTMDGSGKTIVNGQLTIAERNPFRQVSRLQRVLENSGEGLITSNDFVLGRQSSSGGTLRNLPGATLTLEGGALISAEGSEPNLVDNQGTMIRVGSGTSRIDASLDNSGTIRVSEGTLQLNVVGIFPTASTTNSGALELDSGRLFVAAPIAFDAGTTVTGPGLLEVRSTLTINEDVTIENLKLGHVVPNGTSTQHLFGTISGAGDLTVNGELDWWIGTMDGTGTTIVNGQLTIAERNSFRQVSRLQRVLENNGQGLITSNDFVLGRQSSSGGTLRNLPGARLTLEGGALISAEGSEPNLVDNQGTMIRVGSGTSRIDASLDNSGTIRVSEGTLQLNVVGIFPTASTTNSGALELDSGRLFVAAPIAFDAGTTVMGSGLLDLRSTLTVNEDVAIENLKLGHVIPNGTSTQHLFGTISGAGDLTVNGELDWWIGTMDGSGKTIVNGQLTIAERNPFRQVSRLQRVLENNGEGLITSNDFVLGRQSSSGGTLRNLPGATLTIEGDAFIGAEGSEPNLVDNQGTVIRLGSGTSRIDADLQNNGMAILDGGSLALSNVTNDSGGTIGVLGGTLTIDGNLTLGDTSGISTRPTGTIVLKGSLASASPAETLFTPDGTLVFEKASGSFSPYALEAMGRDLGPVADGFDKNFSFGTVEVRSESRVVRLRDNEDNAPGASPEAVYIDTLYVDSSSTLDTNGVPLYVRQALIEGTVIGDYTVVDDSGPLIFNSNNPGTISKVNEVDEWTFYGRAGSAVTLIADPGSTSSYGVVPPNLDGMTLTLIAPDGSQVISDESATVGQQLVLNGVPLNPEGVYRVQVEANGLAASGIGNYSLAAYEATVDTSTLILNQPETGSLESPYSVDRWTFTAESNDQIRFDLLASNVRGLNFELTGPEGWVGFTGQTVDSPLISLPATGTYVLEATTGGKDDGVFSFEVEKTNATELVLGQATAGTLPGAGSAMLYRFNVTDPGPISIELSDTAQDNRNELYVGFGSPPNRRRFNFAATEESSSQSLDISYANPGQWYVLVYGQSTATGSPFTITASSEEARLDSVVPQSSLQLPSAFLSLEGLGFLPGTMVELIDPATLGVFAASEVTISNPKRITAEFDLSSLSAKSYDVQITLPDLSTRTLSQAFEIVAETDASFEADLIVPRRGINIAGGGILYLEYANTGDVPIPAPVLTVEPANPDNAYPALMTLDKSEYQSRFWSSVESDSIGTSVRIYAQGESAGFLQPGEQVSVPIYYRAVGDANGRDSTLTVRVREAGDSEAVDWPTYIAESKPETDSEEAWNAVAGNLVTLLGNTWDEYINTLSDNASYLDRLGREVSDVDELFDFIYQQANGIGVVPVLASATDASVPVPGIGLSHSRSFGNTITQRYSVGPFGRGWQAPSQAALEVDGDGIVRVIEPGGFLRSFEPDRRYFNRFVSGPEEIGTLVPIGGDVYQLVEASGLVRQFGSDGALQFTEGTDGNRLSFGYTDGNLSALTHSSGESITIAYNAEGLIDRVTDSSGWSTSYTYDPAHQLLLSATNPAGTTMYAYVTGQGPQRQFALASIEDATGVTTSFEYDALGRLAASFLGTDEGRVEYAYGKAGRVATVDEAHNRLIYSFDQVGGISRLEDTTGSYLLFDYDIAGNLIRTTDTFGATEEFSWNRSRQLLSVSDQLRGELRFAPGGPNNQPLSFTDSRGNTIRYQLDPAGNLLGRIFPDGSIERFEYDDGGSLIATNNRRNQQITRTVNSLGQLTREDFPDGSANIYTYDVRNRLESVDNRGAVTTYNYDSADRVTRIDYPKSRWLAYEYDAAGRRTRLEDHTGHVVQYDYDNVGRLSRLLDASDELIVTYDYDDAGRLSRETHGNGTTTTYVHDIAGRIETVLNERADGTDNSRFDYSYDTLGRRVGMVTLDGSWTYEYDASGQLIHAIFASTNAEIPDQDLIYEYDSAGNRIRTVRNGEETIYETNNLNQIVSAGDTTFRYDVDGNLIQESGPDGVKSYTYNIENRLIRVAASDGIWEYEYDAFGNRIASIVDGERTEYLIDPGGVGNVTSAFDREGQRVSSYVYGYGLESRNDLNAVYFFDYDALGSTSGVSSTDGNYVNRYLFLPFGESLSSIESIENEFEFVGREGVTNENNNLHFMRDRFYNAQRGDFLSMDRLRLTSGDANFYRYALNSPQMFSDPLGLSPRGPNATGSVPCTPENEPVDITGVYLSGATSSSPCSPQPPPPLPPPCHDNDEGGENNPEREPVDITGTYLAGNNPDSSKGLSLNSSTGNSAPCNSGAVEPPDAPSSGGRSVDEGSVSLRRPTDPNEKISLTGFGDSGFVTADDLIPYRVKFENLGPGSEPTPARPATAPAQRVVITDELSEDLDWSTLQFTQYGFGDYLVILDDPSQYHFETLEVEIDGESFQVEVELSLDAENGVVQTVFQSIDPEFGLPPFGLTGMLPPEDGNGIGQGFVEFVVQTNADLPTGTEIRNIAEIRFDGAEIIATNQVDPLDPSQGTSPDLEALVTIDADAPQSNIAPAATTTSGGEILLVWSGEDGAQQSGVRDYTIYVAEGGGDPVAWIERTNETQATFPITLGTRYSFFSVATDNVGNVEPEPVPFDLNVVGGPAPTVRQVIVNGGDAQRSTVDEVTVVFDRVVEIDDSQTVPFEVVNVDSGDSVGLAYTISQSDGKTIVDLTFLPGPSVNAAGGLIDGNYQLRVLSRYVVGDGLIMDGDADGASGDDYVFGSQAADAFFRFFGDTDGDRDVDGQDYGRFGLTFLKRSGETGFNAELDFDSDGDVDGQDYGVFGLNFLQTI
ncbi:hypothetical protein NZK35_09600 [Stieleria sp. ICT_E10.1]|uniref:RHS repeat-associated core domain-containing protein n=1 Tax=Stieleria sedimenti TaxID=2976331 RepID=UPI00217F61E0|nr:RHS repeat-associated core domain-containing protein [Stieleria sedimenti]MCS7466898.1 hypothetical protein [Stieleria sedimenti]